jgi:hypothetical protein
MVPRWERCALHCKIIRSRRKAWFHHQSTVTAGVVVAKLHPARPLERVPIGGVRHVTRTWSRIHRHIRIGRVGGWRGVVFSTERGTDRRRSFHWYHGAGDGLRRRAYLRRTLQSRGDGGTGGGGPISVEPCTALRHRAGCRRRRRRGGFLVCAFRCAGRQVEQLRRGIEYLWRRWPLSAGAGARHRGRDHRVVPDRDRRRDIETHPGRLCADRDWSGADLLPSGLDTNQQRLAEPGALDGHRHLRWRRGAADALAVLGGRSSAGCSVSVALARVRFSACRPLRRRSARQRPSRSPNSTTP